MKPHHLFVLVILSMFLVTACSSMAATEIPPTSTPFGPQITLSVSGSGSVTGVLNAIQPMFEADMPGYRPKVLPGSGTGGGVKGIVGGVLDVAGMARPPKNEEAAQGVEYISFGQAGQTVITHPEVGIDNLTERKVDVQPLIDWLLSEQGRTALQEFDMITE